MSSYFIGLDLNTDVLQALHLNTTNCKEGAIDVHFYKRWKSLEYCNPIINQFREHHQNDIEDLKNTIKIVKKKSGVDFIQTRHIAIDTTGYSPLPHNREGQPLAFT